MPIILVNTVVEEVQETVSIVRVFNVVANPPALSKQNSVFTGLVRAIWSPLTAVHALYLQRWYSNPSVLGTFPFWVFVTFPASALCVFRCFFCRVSRRHNGAVHPWTDFSLNSSLCELHSSADRNVLVVIGAFGLEREISTNKRKAFFRVDWNARIRNSSFSSEVLFLPITLDLLVIAFCCASGTWAKIVLGRRRTRVP